MNSTPKRIITVSSPTNNGRWSTPKRICVESETGLSVLARLETRPSVCGLEPTLIPNGPNPGDIIEMTGAAGSGKSIMALHMIVSVLLPKTWKGVHLGGFEGSVVFVDNDMHFNILIFERMLQKRVSMMFKYCKNVLKTKSNDEKGLIHCAQDINKFLKSGKQHYYEELNKMTKACLNNFIYLKCSDSNQFALTLLSMDELFQSNMNISLVVLDCMSAFYWYDRNYRADTWYKLEQYYNRIFKVFVNYIRKHKIVLISTRQSLFQKRKNKEGFANSLLHHLFDENTEEFTEYEYMGKEWSKSITNRICLSIIDSPISGTGEKIVAHASGDISIEPQELSENVGKNTIDGKSSGKLVGDRTKYNAEVIDKVRKVNLPFTIHDEGVKWIT